MTVVGLTGYRAQTLLQQAPPSAGVAMTVERSAGGASLVEVLDRILDKGIVIDAWVRVRLVGIDVLTVDARVVVASLDTYLGYGPQMGRTSPPAGPVLRTTVSEIAVEHGGLPPPVGD